MVAACPGMAGKVMRKGQIVDPFGCEREQSRQFKDRVVIYWEELV